MWSEPGSASSTFAEHFCYASPNLWILSLTINGIQTRYLGWNSEKENRLDDGEIFQEERWSVARTKETLPIGCGRKWEDRRRNSQKNDNARNHLEIFSIFPKSIAKALDKAFVLRESRRNSNPSNLAWAILPDLVFLGEDHGERACETYKNFESIMFLSY